MPRRNTAHSLAGMTVLAWLSLSYLPWATPIGSEDDLLRSAMMVFERAVDIRAAAIPASVLIRARGIAVFPASAEEASRYSGVGVLSARGANPGNWTPPAIITLTGALPGDLALETHAVDFVVIAQTMRGLDYLSQERFAMPLIAPIVQGPHGHDTDVRLDADLLGYMQFGDYFAGVTIREWTISEAKSWNAQLYGRPYSTADILGGAGFFHLPPAARAWRNSLRDYYKELS